MESKPSSAATAWLLRKSRRQIPAVALLSILNMLMAAASLWLALLTKDLIDAANTLLAQPLPGSVWECVRQPIVAKPATLVMCVVLAQVVLNILISNVRVRATTRLEMSLTRSLFKCLMHADYTAVYHHHTGELMNRLTGDVSLIARNITTLIPTVVSMATRIVGGIVVLTSISPWFTVGVAVVAVLVFSCSRVYGKYAKRLHKLCQESGGRTRSFMQEVLGNLLSVKAFGSQPQMETQLNNYQRENFRHRIQRNAVGNLGNTGIYLVMTATYYLALLCGVVMMIAGSLSVGTLAALLQIFEQIQSPIRNAAGLLPQYYAMAASAERVIDLEELKPESAEPLPAEPSELFRTFSKLSFQNVTFAYEDGADILDDVDITVNRGEIVALVGESGIGKSTVIKLILSILTQQKGNIDLVCGEHTLPVDAATRLFFSYVPQGNTVLSGTVRDNIAFFRPQVEDKRLHEVLQLACLDEFINSLPEGLNAVIGEHGYGVSEGQAQRIAIARALLNDAPILLLDECTSALDAQTEERLLHNLRTLTDKTVLIVSHKDGAIAGSDRVVRLKDGKMIEMQ